jgi:hypothetical protein
MMELGQMDRRALLTRALLLVGAGVAASACATLEPLAAATPATITPAQLATLTAVADTVIPRTDTPGAVDVEVPGLFSALMDNWAAPETRTMLLAVLERIEDLPGNGRSFADLHSDEQKMLLQRFDAAALAPSGARGSPFGPPPASDPGYQRLKQLILTLYYLSQPALTQELAYTHVPGRWEPSIPVTPATRPQGGPGMF